MSAVISATTEARCSSHEPRTPKLPHPGPFPQGERENRSLLLCLLRFVGSKSETSNKESGSLPRLEALGAGLRSSATLKSKIARGANSGILHWAFQSLWLMLQCNESFGQG